MYREVGKAASQQEKPASVHQGQGEARRLQGEKAERRSMEEGELGPPSQEESGEEAALHYEEHITRLLVTIVRLQGKVERLQQERAREEEEGDFSDLGSESTASLPRCPSLLARRARSPSPPPPAGPEPGTADLFLGVHKALSSLENLLLSYRKPPPSGEAQLQGGAQLAQGLEAGLGGLQREGTEDPPCERMAALYRERNAALRAQLEAQQELLSRSKASVAAHQQQRHRLHRKVQELQESLSRVETCAGGAPSPPGEGAQDPPSGSAQNGPHPPWGATSFLPAPSLPACPPAEILEQLHRCLEGLRGLNRGLSGALQESKTDAEQLSLLLGRQESHQTGLALALHSSERCLEAYETLLALTAAEQNPSPEMGAEAGGASEDPNPALENALWIVRACSMADGRPCDQEGVPERSLRPRAPQGEAKRRLQGFIRQLRAQQSSLKLPAHPPPAGLATVAARLSAGIAAKVAEGRRAVQEEALPGWGPPPRMEKGQLLRELHSAQEALADLGTRLHLTAKAKQGLALWAHTLPAQEAACLLVIRTLQGEQRDLRGQPDPSPESSSDSEEEEDSGAWAPQGLPQRSPPAAPEDAEGSLAQREPQALRLRVLETSTRVRALKERLQGLWVDLEEKSQDYRAHEAQEMELMQDLFQAHSALLLAYQKARHKQESQVGQLEAQVGLMTRRQARQRQALAQTLRQLQDQVPAGAPTGLPQAPAPDEGTQDPPRSLEAESEAFRTHTGTAKVGGAGARVLSPEGRSTLPGGEQAGFTG